MNYSEYSEDWRDIIRPAILKRDSYTCQHCGIRHKSEVYTGSKNNYIVVDDFSKRWAKEQGKKVYTVFLQVAHVDQNKMNNEGTNLIALCPRCHSKFDAQHKSLKRKMLLSSDKSTAVKKSVTGSDTTQMNLFEFKHFLYELVGVKFSIQDCRKIVDVVQKNKVC